VWSPGRGGTRQADVLRGSLKVWDVPTGKLLLSYAPDKDEEGFNTQANVLFRDGEVVLLTGAIVSGEPARPGPHGGVRGPRPERWFRVLEVAGGKVLFDSRKEPTEGRWIGATLSRDARRLVAHEASNPGTDPHFSRCKVWDLGATGRKPVTIEGDRSNV